MLKGLTLAKKDKVNLSVRFENVVVLENFQNAKMLKQCHQKTTCIEDEFLLQQLPWLDATGCPLDRRHTK